jgi:hypothetical protein
MEVAAQASQGGPSPALTTISDSFWEAIQLALPASGIPEQITSAPSFTEARHPSHSVGSLPMDISSDLPSPGRLTTPAPSLPQTGMPLKHLSSCPLTLKSRKFSLPRSTRRHAPQARLPHPFLLVPCQVSARPITSLPPPFPSEMTPSTHWRSAQTPPCRRFTPPKHRMSQIWAPHVGGGR